MATPHALLKYILLSLPVVNGLYVCALVEALWGRKIWHLAVELLAHIHRGAACTHPSWSCLHTFVMELLAHRVFLMLNAQASS